MERQYIGARYVPIFFENPNTGDSTWLTGVAYEALTIVTFAGNSYTSKKPVPAGIGSPNLNPEYWVSTGNFNAQIDELREEIEDIQNNIDDIIPITPDDVEAKKYILLADSFGNPETVGGNTWIENFKNIVGSENVYSGHSSSGGFVHQGTNGTYLTLLTSIAANISNKEQITDIIVQTAGNDANETRVAIETALGAFVSYCKTNFPYAKIHIAVTSKTETETPDNHYNITYKIIPTLIDHQYLGYHYMTNVEYAMHGLTTVDSIHPTPISSQYLAGHIYIAATYGSTSVFYRWPTVCTPLRDGAASTYYTSINNNITVFTIGGESYNLVFNDANGVSMAYINLDYATLPYTAVCSLAQFAINVTLQITLDDNTTRNICAMLRLLNDDTNHVTKLHLETAGFEARLTIKKIHLYKFSITAPTNEML